MIEEKLERVPPDSPDRCQGTGQHGQCPFKKEHNNDYCPRHAASIDKKQAAIAAANMYRLGQYQARVNDFASHDEIKSLRAEIGILRMTLEHIVIQCHNPILFAVHSGRIADLVMKIEKLITSCQRLEIRSGEMIDKTKALHLGTVIVEIVSQHIEDGEILEEISTGILQAIVGISAA